jgi:hypothetical protein
MQSVRKPLNGFTLRQIRFKQILGDVEDAKECSEFAEFANYCAQKGRV